MHKGHKESKKAFKIFLSILIVTLSISTALAQPTQQVSFQDVEIDFMSDISWSQNIYWNNYDYISIQFTDPVTSQFRSLATQFGSSDDGYFTNHMDVALFSFSNNIYLYIESYETDVEPFEITVEACDFQTLQCAPTDSFMFEIEGTYSPGSAPNQIASFPSPLVLTGEDSEFYLLNNFFNDYNTAEYSFYDPIADTNVDLIVSKGGTTTSSYVTANIEVYLIPYSNNIGLEIVGKDVDFGPETTTVIAENEFGDTSTNFVLETKEAPTTPPPSEGDGLLDGLVSYWKFDETTGTTAEDSHGSNDGDVIDATWTTSGKINGGLDFDGTNGNRVNTDYSQASNTDYSYAFWFQYRGTSPGALYFRGTSTNTIGRHATFINDGDIEIFIDGEFNLIDELSLSEDTWYHFVVTKEGATIKAYLDGVNVDTFTGGTSSSDSYILDIGGRGSNGGADTASLDGKIDEFGIWDRPLSSSEIEELYNEGDGLSYEALGEESEPEPEPEPPSQIASFPSTLSYSYNDADSLSLNQFFTNYDSITVSWTDPITSSVESITRSKGQATTGIVRMDGGEFVYDISLNPTSTNIIWSIETGEVDWETTDLIFTAQNNEGNAEGNSIILSIEETVEEGDPPLQVTSPSNIIISPTSNIKIDFKDYFLQPTYNDVRASLLVGSTIFEIDEAGTTDVLISTVTFSKSQGGSLLFQDNAEGTVSIVLTAINDFGETSTDTFTITFDEEAGASALTGIVDSFIGLFPASEGLNLGQRLGTVAVVMILVSIIAGFGMSQGGSISQGAIYVIVLANVSLFLFFIGIGYIPTWILVFIILISIAYISLPFITNRAGA